MSAVGDSTALVHALGDAAPRVRAEAARGLANVPAARDALIHRLTSDGWPSVRAQCRAVDIPEIL